MEFLPVLSAWQWALVAAVPPAIVALYFLKLRRQPLEVPSTYLWRKSLEDLHVNSLWQRLRQSLLLYLQLLLVLLVLLALLRPGWRSTKLVDDRNILLIDNSASMGAKDVAPTRLAEAKRRALALVDNLQTEVERQAVKQQLGSQASGLVDAGPYQALVISFSDTARVEQGWTSNVRDLRQAIENIQLSNRTTEIGEALRVASGLANSPRLDDDSSNKPTQPPPTKLFIFSDGKFPPVPEAALANLEPVFVPIGRADAANVGIVSFSVRRNDERDNELQAFGTVENFGDKTVTAPVDLLLDGKLIDASPLAIKPGDTAGVSFSLGDTQAGILEMRLSHDDALAADNHAWAAINRSRRPKVLLVTSGNPALELAVSTARAGQLTEVSVAPPSILETPAQQKAAANGAWDLIIYDRCRPGELPRANTLFIGEVPPPANQSEQPLKESAPSGNGQLQAATNQAPPTSAPASDAGASATAKGWSLGDPVVSPQIIDVDPTHPLTQWLDLGDVDIAQGRPVTPPPGSTRLIDSNKGTLLAITPREGFEDTVMGFEIYTTDAAGHPEPNTNWPIRRSFPAFVYAALNYLSGGDTQGGQSLRAGQPLVIKTDVAADHLIIVTPSGIKRTALRGPNGSFNFTQTEELGPYQVLDGEKTVQWFTVNLLNEPESNIAVSPQISLKIGNRTVQASPEFRPVRREMWPWLLPAALAVLLLEWYIYNRRVYV